MNLHARFRRDACDTVCAVSDISMVTEAGDRYRAGSGDLLRAGRRRSRRTGRRWRQQAHADVYLEVTLNEAVQYAFGWRHVLIVTSYSD